MSFVFPFLLGSVALVGIPVLIHLIMRQKPRTLQFPAFRFLLQRHRTNLRKLRLRHLLLLAFRMLLIAGIALALARPQVTHQGLDLRGDRPVAALLLFDTSKSMEYKSSDGESRLAEAKKRAHELLDELPEGSRVAILDTADLVQSASPQWFQTMSEARKRIAGRETKTANAPVSQRIENAFRFLADGGRDKDDERVRQLPRVLFVFSDRTRASWDASRTTALRDASDLVPPTLAGLRQARGDIGPLVELLGDLRARLPPAAGQDYPEQSLLESLAQLKDLVPRLTPEDLPPDNELGKVIAQVRRWSRELLDVLGARKDVSDAVKEYHEKLRAALHAVVRDLSGVQAFFVDVGVEQPIDLALLDLALPTQADGQPQQLLDGDRTFVLRALVQATGKDASTGLSFRVGNKSFEEAVDIKAGERLTRSFEVNPKQLGLGPGQHSAEVHLKTPDQLGFNNSRYVTFGIREPRRVLVLADEPDRAGEFVKALWAFDFAPEVVRLDDSRSLDLVAYQAVYLFAVKEPSAKLWSALEDYVLKGGGLGIVPPGKELVPASYDLEPAQRVLPGKLVTIVEHKDKAGAWNFEQDSIYQHPLLQPFRRWRDTDIFVNPRQATLSWEVQPAKAATVLISYADEKKLPALLERRFDGKQGRGGKVLLFTTTLDPRKPAWNNYLEALHSFYPILVGLSTNYLAGETERPQLNFSAGQADPVVPLPLSPRYQRYVLAGPGVLRELSLPEEAKELICNQAVEAGNYTVNGRPEATNRFSARFSVNVPAEESDLTRVPVAELEAVLGPGSVLPANRRATIRTLLEDHWSEPLELFPPLMLILLFVLALENLLANKFYRKAPEPRDTV